MRDIDAYFATDGVRIPLGHAVVRPASAHEAIVVVLMAASLAPTEAGDELHDFRMARREFIGRAHHWERPNAHDHASRKQREIVREPAWIAA